MQSLTELKDQNPIFILQQWLQEAQEHPEAKEPTAMVLSTIKYKFDPGAYKFNISAFHWPTSRVVLLKEIQADQLIFYTNYASDKGKQCSGLPVRLSGRQVYVALNFYWNYLGKQVRIIGKIKKTSREKSIAYWNSRSRESQISQYISKQSEKLDSRETLEKKWQEAQSQFAGKDIPCPAHWGGYAITAYFVEFWQERPHRLHDRLQFKRKEGFFKKTSKWTSTLVYP